MKSLRQDKIIELINTHDISTQEELAEMLNAEGFKVTQATVSRDIKLLNLKKKAGPEGKQKYYASVISNVTLSDKYVRVFCDGYVSMDMAMNILVIKTVSGMAMAVAAAIDSMNFSEVVGSIAGDDTIMCAIRTVEDTRILMEKLKNILAMNE